MDPSLLSSVVSDLCATGDHDCEQVCISSPGSYTCACHEGFTLNSDGKTCNGQWLGTGKPWGGSGEMAETWLFPRDPAEAPCSLWTDAFQSQLTVKGSLPTPDPPVTLGGGCAEIGGGTEPEVKSWCQQF